MKTIFIFLFLFLSSCISLPNNPQNSKSEYECTNSCASVGMKAVYTGGQCGCEKR
ncbi:MAG: hypothetical protein ABL930_09215 [Pseudobdellovibrio sp.]